MDPALIPLVLAAGVGMGAINNIAGGAGVFGLMAFEYGCKLPFDVANPSTRPGAIGVGLFAWLGYRRLGHRPERRVWRLAVWALLGAFVGVLLEEQRNEVLFRGYLALVMLALLIQQLRPRSVTAANARLLAPWVANVGCFLIGVHMGYVQIGTGLLATLVLQATYSRDLVATNVAKSVIVILSSIASVVGFAAEPWLHPTRTVVISWQPALWLAVGTAAGSYLGSRWAVKNGTTAIRRVVIAVSLYSLGDQLWHLIRLVPSGG